MRHCTDCHITPPRLGYVTMINSYPLSFMRNKQCKELAFPVLFPKGRYE